MALERGIHALNDNKGWDGIAFLDAQARVELRHRLARMSRKALVEIIVEQEDAIGDLFGALLEAEQTTLVLKELRIRNGKMNTKNLDNRLKHLQMAMDRCRRAFTATENKCPAAPPAEGVDDVP